MLSSTPSRRVLASSARTVQPTAMASFASAITSTLLAPLHRQAHSSSAPAQRDPAYRVLTSERINKNVLEAQYAVRGAIPLRAEELREQLEDKGKDAGLPFDTVVNCNIGNPQQLDQKPLTFLRQVSSAHPQSPPS
jgi:alanine transaminase